MMNELGYNHHCFGCGEQNPQGLKLKFHREGDAVKAAFVPRREHQGYPGLLHGGITSTLLDEIMSQAINHQGEWAVTARLEVRFRQAIPIAKPLLLEGRITGRKGPVIDTEGKILAEDGALLAEAKGRFMVIKELPDPAKGKV